MWFLLNFMCFFLRNITCFYLKTKNCTNKCIADNYLLPYICLPNQIIYEFEVNFRSLCLLF